MLKGLTDLCLKGFYCGFHGAAQSFRFGASGLLAFLWFGVPGFRLLAALTQRSRRPRREGYAHHLRTGFSALKDLNRALGYAILYLL